jgi:outer membrane protein assembly factor BamB
MPMLRTLDRTRRRGPNGVARALMAMVAATTLVAAAPGATAAPTSDWPAYLYGPQHPSFGASAAITSANVGSLVKQWTFKGAAPTMTGQPGPAFAASPTVSGTRVYIGSNTGVFYALDRTTGAIVWSRFLGFVTAKTCNARGITATATVAADPVSGAPVVYVSGGDGYLYALSAATGAVRWRSVIAIPSSTQNDYYDWSSPTVANGSVYIGMSSQCDAPLVRAGVKKYDQATGALQATYYSTPAGTVGASVWSSVAATGTAAFATTGNGKSGDAFSIVRLRSDTLSRIAKYTVPGTERSGDADFGASPTIFAAGTTPMVGACNKNGFYYAIRASDLALRWKFKIAQGSNNGTIACLAAAAWDGSRLYMAGPATTISGTDYRGSIRALDPSTGAAIWQRGLGGGVIGSPSLNGSNVLAVPTWDAAGGNGVYLVDATNGTVLRFLAGGQTWAQPTFAGDQLLVASYGNRLIAWHLP